MNSSIFLFFLSFQLFLNFIFLLRYKKIEYFYYILFCFLTFSYYWIDTNSNPISEIIVQKTNLVYWLKISCLIFSPGILVFFLKELVELKNIEQTKIINRIGWFFIFFAVLHRITAFQYEDAPLHIYAPLIIALFATAYLAKNHTWLIKLPYYRFIFGTVLLLIFTAVANYYLSALFHGQDYEISFFNFFRFSPQKIILLVVMTTFSFVLLQKQKKIELGYLKATFLLEKQAIENKKLEEVLSEVAALTAAREHFFSIIAHDMRRPLHAFQGLSEMLHYYLKNDRHEELQKISKAIENSSLRINHLLENLLEWALAQRKIISYVPQKIDVEKNLREILYLFEYVDYNKDINISLNCEYGITMYADPKAIEILVRNLLDNALRYLPNHNAKIEISASSKIGKQVEIIFKDNGTGIPLSKLNFFNVLFEDTQKYEPGVHNIGLGLWLIGTYVAQNKGKIKVQSVLKEGTSFFISLPAYSEKII